MGNVQTRQFDAKGMAHRRGSINWNFHYNSPRRRDGATMMVNNVKMSIADWLAVMDLQEYEVNLQMFNCVEDILDLDDNDLRERGINNAVHRSKMLASLFGVQAKRRQSVNIEVSTLPRSAVRRKNSCPPLYLTDASSIFQAQTLPRNSTESPSTGGSNRHLTISTVGGTLNTEVLARRRSSDTIYEELSNPDSDTSVPSTTCAHSDSDLDDPTTSIECQTTMAGVLPTNYNINLNNSHNANNEQQEANALKKALEWELSLDSKDLRSHAWYHGPLPRQRAEEIVQQEGEFLIRDCTSQPDNYVLTCRTKKSVLHFVINKVLLQPETVYERIQYQFEEDAFDTVPDLITFYVGSGRIISAASCARIKIPCNRAYPLSFYGHKIINNQLHTQMLAGQRGGSALNSPLAGSVSGGFRFGATSGVPTNGGPTNNMPTTIVPVNNVLSPQQQQMQQLQQQQMQQQQMQQQQMQQQHLTSQQLQQLQQQQMQQQQIQQQQILLQQQTLHSPLSSPPRPLRGNTPPRIPNKNQRSQSLTPAQAQLFTNMQQMEAGSNVGVGAGSIQQIFQCDVINGGFHERRFSTLEKCHSVSGSVPLDAHIEQLQQQQQQQFHSLNHNKIHINGFQTIARTNVGEVLDHFKFTTHSLPRPNSGATGGFRGSNCGANMTGRISGLVRDTSLDSTFLNAAARLPDLPEKPPCPPPKPTRAPSLPRKERDGSWEQQQHVAAWQRAPTYHASGSDSGNGSGDSVPGDFVDFAQHRGVIIKNPRFMSNSASSMTLKSLTEFDADAVEAQLFTMEIPEFKLDSKFDLENYSTLLLPTVENKPLDGDALSTFKMMFLESGASLIAEHLTHIDVGLLIDEHPEKAHNVLQCCGLEMITLPQGKVFRNDMIERTQCIKLLVAVTILTCQTDMDRAELLSKWIQVAVETKTALGNLFGFTSIMLGLCMPQIQKLDQAWHILRQHYTDSAFVFESKLRPILNNMNECNNPQAPNTTVPHVLLYILLKDRPTLDILNTTIGGSTTEHSSLYTTCVTSWESKAEDFGMSINFLHFDSARGFLQSLDLYRKNARILLEEARQRQDELLMDSLRTEFHIKFLWGSNGALATPEERHSKLEKVLSLMADKFCSVDMNGTTAG